MNDKYLSHLIDLKESVARIEQEVRGNSRDIALGVSAHERVGKLETRISTLWAVVAAIPVIGAAVALFMPDIKVPIEHREYRG